MVGVEYLPELLSAFVSHVLSSPCFRSCAPSIVMSDSELSDMRGLTPNDPEPMSEPSPYSQRSARAGLSSVPPHLRHLLSEALPLSSSAKVSLEESSQIPRHKSSNSPALNHNAATPLRPFHFRIHRLAICASITKPGMPALPTNIKLQPVQQIPLLSACRPLSHEV